MAELTFDQLLETQLRRRKVKHGVYLAEHCDVNGNVNSKRFSYATNCFWERLNVNRLVK